MGLDFGRESYSEAYAMIGLKISAILLAQDCIDDLIEYANEIKHEIKEKYPYFDWIITDDYKNIYFGFTINANESTSTKMYVREDFFDKLNDSVDMALEIMDIELENKTLEFIVKIY